ncbi:putative membrane protein [Marivirga sericea]|uniref:Putative membrane protein n=1 Tax=Marivirga sericea TaxID=1028 RepID=A0A1X7KPG1_9BACT|nr:carotenoid biosynthesis protein [Marivirga sericea]SMG43063.1 putative membrane protein [Marivirga sericea]
MNAINLTSIIKRIKSSPLIGLLIISAFYFFGIIGILSNNKEWFIEKTAFNLSLSFLILLTYQKKYSWSLLWAFLFCYFIGFLAEYLGVNFGLIFGDYIYPDTLGPQLGGVPIIIGVNWFLITFCVASLLFPFNINGLLKIVLATIITVLIDVLIEPVAMKLDFWNWENDTIPFQNYLGWAVISFLIFSFYSIVKLPVQNKVAFSLLIWQIIFFAALNIFLI